MPVSARPTPPRERRVFVIVRTSGEVGVGIAGTWPRRLEVVGERRPWRVLDFRAVGWEGMVWSSYRLSETLWGVWGGASTASV